MHCIICHKVGSRTLCTEGEGGDPPPPTVKLTPVFKNQITVYFVYYSMVSQSHPFRMGTLPFKNHIAEYFLHYSLDST